MADIDYLAEEILAAARHQSGSRRRYVIGISGIPGSGKSYLAYPLQDRINEIHSRHSGFGDIAICVGVDGWHLSREELSQRPDSAMLMARRGAHFTYDAESYASFVNDLYRSEEVSFPTFSHAAKDPVKDGGIVRSSHRIVIIEGLHAFLDVSPWREAAQEFDQRIWVDTPRSIARDRLVGRHLAEGVETSLQAAIQRVEQSDLLNADFLLANLVPPTKIVSTERAVDTVNELLSTDAIPGPSVRAASVATAA